MFYVVASFLAPLLLEEATSSAVERFITGLPAGTLAVSQWTRVEFMSLLARWVRMGGLDRQTAEEVDTQFEAIIVESFAVLLPRANDFDLTRQYLRNHDTGLRADGALHLAIARNNHAEAVYSFDTTLLKAGAAFGVPVSAGIQTA